MNSDHTKPILDQGFDACVAKLTDFGYHNITPEMIKAAHERWKRGDESTDVIEKFAFGDFDKHPAIFGIKSA